MAIVSFFSDDEEGTSQFLAANMIGHSLFLLFNVINATYLILVQGFGLGRLQKDTLLKLTLAGCLLQHGSCIASITRWNLGTPHAAQYGIPSAVFGIVAHVPCDMVYFFLAFHRAGQAGIVKAGCAALTVLGVLLSVLTYTNWDDSTESFKYLLMYGPISTLWHIFAVWKHRSDRAKGEVDGVMAGPEEDSVSKILLTAILIDVVAIGLEGGAPKVFSNGAPGMHFCATLLVAIFAGKKVVAGGGSLPQYGTIS